MKKLFVLLFFVVFLSACSLYGNRDDNKIASYNLASSSSTVCPVVTSDTTNTTTSAAIVENLLPPVSAEETRKVFTYEDEEMGVKLKYPGSCFFNKGIFQCTNFTMSIWVVEGTKIPAANPEINLKDKETEIKYYYVRGSQTYILVAWYNGQNQTVLEANIDKIAKTFSFTR